MPKVSKEGGRQPKNNGKESSKGGNQQPPRTARVAQAIKEVVGAEAVADRGGNSNKMGVPDPATTSSPLKSVG